MISVVFQTHGKADISRGMKQYVVPFGTHHIQGADHTAQHAIFIADVLRLESGHTVALLLPPDNGSIIFFRWIKISIGRMLHTLHHGLHNRWYGREIHVSYPHWDPVKAFLHLCARNRNVLYCNRIFSVAIQNRSKIVFHNHLFPFVSIVNLFSSYRVFGLASIFYMRNTKKASKSRHLLCDSEAFCAMMDIL